MRCRSPPFSQFAATLNSRGHLIRSVMQHDHLCQSDSIWNTSSMILSVRCALLCFLYLTWFYEQPVTFFLFSFISNFYFKVSTLMFISTLTFMKTYRNCHFCQRSLYWSLLLSVLRRKTIATNSAWRALYGLTIELWAVRQLITWINYEPDPHIISFN